MRRDPLLRHFIEAVVAGLSDGHPTLPEARAVCDRMSAGLRQHQDPAPSPRPAYAQPAACRLPACRHLPAALNAARAGPARIRDLADALAAIEPRLAWYRSASAREAGPDFLDGHANAVVLGDEGLEPAGAVAVGISLVAPGILYPRHRHAPEEVYVVLSEGSWMASDGPFRRRGPGDLAHTPPGAWHAMRAGTVPLLAIWCLSPGQTPAVT